MAQDPTKPNRELSQPCIGHDAIHNFDAMVEMFGKILAKKKISEIWVLMRGVLEKNAKITVA
jgi:hypothetical protein